MRFTIIKTKADVSPPEYTCDFLPPGGTIGRSVDNNLVLPDEDRAISRLQAIVHIASDGSCQIINKGTVSKMYLNGTPLVKDKKTPVTTGDILGIAGYKVQIYPLWTEVDDSAAKSVLAAVNDLSYKDVPVSPVSKQHSVVPPTQSNNDSNISAITNTHDIDSDNPFAAILMTATPSTINPDNSQNTNNDIQTEIQQDISAVKQDSSSLLKEDISSLLSASTYSNEPTDLDIHNALFESDSASSNLSILKPDSILIQPTTDSCSSVDAVNKADVILQGSSKLNIHAEEIAMNKPTSSNQQASSSQESADKHIPNEIWDDLITEFASEHIDVQSNTDNFKTLTDVPQHNINSTDPLKQLEHTIDLVNLKKRDTDVSDIFNQSGAFDQGNIFSDTTPTTLTDISKKNDMGFFGHANAVSSSITDNVMTNTFISPHSLDSFRTQDPSIDPIALFSESSRPTTQPNVDPVDMFTTGQPLTSVTNRIEYDNGDDNPRPPSPLTADQQFISEQIDIFSDFSTRDSAANELPVTTPTQNTGQEPFNVALMREPLAQPLPTAQEIPPVSQVQQILPDDFNLPLMDKPVAQPLPTAQEIPPVPQVQQILSDDFNLPLMDKPVAQPLPTAQEIPPVPQVQQILPDDFNLPLMDKPVAQPLPTAQEIPPVSQVQQILPDDFNLPLMDKPVAQPLPTAQEIPPVSQVQRILPDDFNLPLMDKPVAQPIPTAQVILSVDSVTSTYDTTMVNPTHTQQAVKTKPFDRVIDIDPRIVTPPVRNDKSVKQGDVLNGNLLDAFLKGAGLDDINPPPTIDVQSVELIGKLISRYSQGTIALLSSRSILKRGLKDDTTMILEEANNPFKFLPTGKTVLMQMFGSPMPGFMPPEQAVRDALIDLQAHQLGMIAGIRAIIAAMLQSFNPAKLNADFKRQGLGRSFGLPGYKKAELWDFFVKNHQKTANEVEDDFHDLFGEAFLHAYNIEVNQYRDSQVKPE